ncbi:hypothetical protein OGAPHI_007242 [Ogataea philodendri]|uniref:Translation initiation factor eIF2B subunit epsilon n=1 Tax=Ogataea philodendri TaxID=1378263 RepID=A0A9P8NVA9_9ASCO|nr:uncharacterized protein OGAPHI_007242 [Ogataea philodendri]KAH3660037.1 hypothetical protein OGAPHI_007242 [Ogataea philodendri]
MKKDDLEEQKIQAVVLTDSFQTRFMPLTAIRPRCLLPLANVPLIEYTLEFLAQANVSEVYLMCCSHADQVQQYIDDSKWGLPSSPFTKIQTIMSLESRSVGDAMRDIDSRGLIAGDFVLVSGDVVTNLDLGKVVSLHKQRRTSDRDYIATMVLKQASELHRARSHVEPACFILEKGTDKCLYYQDIPSVDGEKTSVDIDREIIQDVAEFDIRNDLIDCHVDVCSPQVLTIFQENFDYQALRSDFVKGVLLSDLLKKHIYAYVTTDEYAARVESWQTYDGISQDVLERWCYPIVPERNIIDDHTYTYESKHIYKEQDIRLSQSCKIQSRVVIGKDSFIGDGTTIQGSVIGRNCRIGNNVTVRNSYIWDGAVIGDDVVVSHSIVAADAVVGSKSVLNPGTVVGFGVQIDSGIEIPKDTRIVKNRIRKLDDSLSLSETEEEEEETDYSLVGQNGVGHLYSEDGHDDRKYGGMVYQMDQLALSDVSVASNTVAHHHRRKKRTQSTNSVYISEDEEEQFDKEAIATVDRAMEFNHDIDTALLELNTLRMSMNVTYHEVREATSVALVKRVDHFIETQTLGAKEAVEKIFRKWSSLFDRQVFDDEDQVDLLLILQKLCAQLDATYNSVVLLCILVILYDEEVVEEENIYKWWGSDESKSIGARSKVGKWIDWLQEAESEEE